MKNHITLATMNYVYSEYIRKTEENETLKQILTNQMYILQILLEKEGVDVKKLDEQAEQMAKERMERESHWEEKK